MTKRILSDNDISQILNIIKIQNPILKYCPHTPTLLQRQILDCNKAEILVGPGAGAGKTFVSLMLGLKDINNHNSHTLIIRNTYQDLTQAGCQIPESFQWFRSTDAKYNGTDHKWIFPSGASIRFGYLEHEHDKYKYRSSAYTKIIYDEASLLLPDSMEYLFSRQRTTKDAGLRTQTYYLTNPGGPAHEWLHNRFVKEQHPDRAYFHSTLQNNPHLDQQSYLENLKKLTDIQYRQLALGEWILDESKNVYHLSQHNIINGSPPVYDNYIFGIDLGFIDQSAIIILGYNNYEKQCYIVYAKKFEKTTVSDLATYTIDLYEKYKPYQMVMDAAGAGKMICEEFATRYKLPVKPADKTEKENFIKILNADLEHKNLFIYEGCVDLIQELNRLERNKHGKENQQQANHAADAFLYAFKESRHFRNEAKKLKPTEDERWEQNLLSNNNKRKDFELLL